MDGPAGTGKSRAILQKLHYVAGRYRNVRILIWRLTRASITETILPIFETHVVQPGHPCLADGVTRGGRKVYRYPTGSEIIVAGMNNPTAIMSGQFDIAALFEGTEPGLTLTQYEYVLTRLRNGQIHPGNIIDPREAAKMLNRWPRRPTGEFIAQHQMLVDCNPSNAEHWLNRRCEKKIEDESDPLCGQPLMQRIYSRHGDNPSVTPEYMQRLARLTGLRRKRLYEGVWCSAEGQVWPEFDAAVHMVDEEKVPGIAWHFGAIDFGFRGPGCLQIWGVTGNRVLYRLKEWYAKERTEDWWTDRIVDAYRQTPLAAVVCDSAEPDRIAMLNRRLSHEFAGRCLPGIAIKANKAVEMGLGVVRDALAGKRLFLVRDALQERDEALAEDELPLCTEDELPGYVFPVTKDGRPIKETPDPVPPQHGCDTLRYAAVFAWGKQYAEKPKPRKYAPGTLGDMLGHNLHNQ